MVKWFKTVCFWKKLKGTIAGLGIGSEITLYMMDSHPTWKIVAAISSVVGMLITTWIEDTNNDGIVDLFQTKRKHKPNE